MNEEGKSLVDRLRHVLPMPGVEVAFEQYAEGEQAGKIFCIYIGTKWHGPVLSWHHDGWCNLYSRGNYGKNFCCGGNWSADSKRRFPTIADALEHRDYVVAGLKMENIEQKEAGLPELKHLLELALERPLPEDVILGGSLSEILAKLQEGNWP